MRREAGQQVVLNVALQSEMRCTKQGDKNLQITCFTVDGPATYLVKVCFKFLVLLTTIGH